MEFLNKYIKKYWKPFLLAVFCLTVEAVCDLLQPTIMAKIVDVGVKNKDLSFVLKMSYVMLGVTALGALGAVSRNILASIVSQKFGSELRSDLFTKVQGFSFESIDKYDGASLLTRLTNDVTMVQNFTNGLMRIFVKAPLLCIGSFIMAVRLNAKMAMIFVVVIPIVVLLIVMNMKIGYPFFRKIQKALDNVNSVMREYLSGVRVVKAFNRFSYETNRFKKSNKNLSDISTNAMRIMAIFPPGITLIVNLGIVATIWIGGVKVNSGNMQVGEIIAFINYMTQILFSLMMISNVFTMFVRAKASAERIGEVFNEEKTLKNLPELSGASVTNFLKDNGKDSEVKGRIDFENVSFSYPGTTGEPVLKNLTFSCSQGETIGIIGSTGSGKTSMVSLITRFYDVNKGKIKINNIDIRDMDVKNLREKIAIVPQKIVLFSGSIMDNIRWGKEAATVDEIKVAAEAAQAHEFISLLPEGYNTVLGQGGVNISGGQKQRISIARALIKQSEILILDDCTSAVDVTTEAKIRDAIKTYSGKLTCLIIAQRITSVINADKILVLENGELVGKGNHGELMETCEVYKDIFRSQIGKEVVQSGKEE
ncbi:ABC transporter ATP-binding protein/permease [Clostridium sp. CS001]|uniref:ABC transporter ATP-binding protein n=1 Tax=Clostridium sp. CS001 TaxID=2880648 RepID=UPI001CF1AE43|nr:ABC transporter ATP-binding protein [Clostridium sp. CS001]MCB2288648.1 ABC transporter ATP-binding protein/permease [Clostridium sp. CS001]